MNNDRGNTAPDKPATGPVRGKAAGFPEGAHGEGEDVVETLMTGGGGGAAPIDEVYPGHTKDEEARPAQTGLSTAAGTARDALDDADVGRTGPDPAPLTELRGKR